MAAPGNISDPMKQRRKSRLILVLLAVMFAGPLLAATWLYANPDVFTPGGMTNEGELITPTRAVDFPVLAEAAGGAFGIAELRGKWTLVHVAGDACDEACQTALVNTRQIRLALGHNIDRVQRVYLFGGSETVVDPDQMRGEHPDLHLVTGDEDQLEAARNELGPDARGSIYLLDPLGHLVLRYAPDFEARGMLKDVRKLLRISQVG